MTIQTTEITTALHNLELAVRYPTEWNRLLEKKGKWKVGASIAFDHFTLFEKSIQCVQDYLKQNGWESFDKQSQKILKRCLRLYSHKQVWFFYLKDSANFFSSLKDKLTVWTACHLKDRISFHTPPWLPRTKEHHYSIRFNWLGHLSSLIEFELDNNKSFTCIINPNQAESITVLHKQLYMRQARPSQDVKKLTAPDLVLVTSSTPDTFDSSSVSYLSLYQPYLCAPFECQIEKAMSLTGNMQLMFLEKQTAATVWLSCIEPSSLCTAHPSYHTNSYVLSFPDSTACTHYYHFLVFGQFECCSLSAIYDHCKKITKIFPDINMALIPLGNQHSRGNMASYPYMMSRAVRRLNPKAIYVTGIGTWDFAPFAHANPRFEFRAYLNKKMRKRVADNYN